MAFNPFIAFRRHQKVIFATMAIVCMGLFVVSSGVGGGDLLQQFGDWAGRRTASAEAVATLNGKKIDELAVRQSQFNRQLADSYINMAVGNAHGVLLNQAFAKIDKVDEVLKEPIFGLAMIAQARDRGINQPEIILNQFARVQMGLRNARRTLEAGTSPTKAEQLRTVDDLVVLTDRQRMLFEKAILQSREGYFGGEIQKLDDTLDFLIWKDQADKLGIVMTDEDVDIAVQHELLFQKFDPATLKTIDSILKQRFNGYTVDSLKSALRDEFRVRAAKSAILGERVYTQTSPPVGATPDELFDWYKDVRSLVRVGLIEVPVANFLGKVTESPTDAELKALYEKHRTDEYNPAMERPGFKEPRKVKVEWFHAPYTSEFYREAAKQDGLLRAVRQLGSAMPATADGSPLVGLGALLALQPAVGDAFLQRQYINYVDQLPKWTDPFGAGLRSGIHDSSVLRPENIAMLVGSTMAGLSTGPGALLGPLTLEGRSIIREVRDRARIGVSTILGAALDPAPLGVDAILTELVPPATTMATIRDLLVERDRSDLVRWLVSADTERLAAEVAKRSKNSDRNNLEAFINEFTHLRKLARGASQLTDRFSLPTDPGLVNLRDAFNRQMNLAGGEGDPTGAQFAMLLTDGPFSQQRNSRPESFQMQPLATADGVYYMWRSEDREPRAVTFDEARPRVIEAWKFEKARALARAEAERLAADAKNKTDLDLRVLAQSASPRGLLELPPLAVWNSKINFRGGSPDYEPARIPSDKVAYPGAMATPIVDLRKQPVGATTVVHDYPKANFYVAALLSKDEATPEQFRMVYKSSMQPTLRDGLFDLFYGERQQQFRNEIMKQLREEAKLVIHKPDTKSE